MNLLKKINLFLMLMLAGCLLFSTVPAAHGFIALEHYDKEHPTVLIDKVHAPHWTISYDYGDDCPPEARNNDDRLTAAITHALQTWLQPLRGYTDKPIVNDFRYQRSTHHDNTVDLHIIFYCDAGLSKAFIGWDDFPPAISMYDGTKVVRPFMHALIHEVGHTFGLDDTYVPLVHRGKPGFSNGGLESTIGTQPSSVMGSHHTLFFTDAPDDLVSLEGVSQLGADDINGIIWLYKRVYEELPLEDCFFPEYELEEEAHGCRPKYPLIFEIKQGKESWAMEVIKDDSNLDINAQDKDGMTALHYGVLNNFEELIPKILEHKDINPFLRDKQGRTALSIAEEKGFDNIVELLLSHPLALSVGANGKLTTTWEEIKQGD